LVVFRILQGAGGGGLQPSEQAILNDTFPLSKRGMAFAVYGSPWWSRRLSGRGSADGSPTVFRGAGFFISTFPSGSCLDF